MTALAPVGAAPRAVLVTDREVLAASAAEWDALCDACSRPFCGAAWLQAWWDHARPARAELAVVLVRDSGALLGAAPGFCDRGPAGIVRWRPLGAGTCQRVEPFALPGREPDVARELARLLYERRPRPQVLSFEGVSEHSPWPALIASAWPRRGRTRVLRAGAGPALVLDLEGADFDAWFGGKSSHFRQRLRRSRKTALQAGGRFRLADAGSAAEDVEAFLRVHAERWDDRGGSRAVSPAVAAMLRVAGPGMVAAGRLRIWSLDVGRETVASSLVFSAGDELGYWLNGFDAAHARLEPSKISILRVIEDAFASGARRLDLGEGSFAYKRRFTDEEETLLRVTVVPSSPWALQVAVGLAPARARRFLAGRLDEAAKARLREALARLPGR